MRIYLISILICLLGIGIAFAADADKGAQQYKDLCAGCHGDDGTGGFGPSLHGCDTCSMFILLKDKIQEDMPKFRSSKCTGECSANTALYIQEEFNAQ